MPQQQLINNSSQLNMFWAIYFARNLLIWLELLISRYCCI